MIRNYLDYAGLKRVIGKLFGIRRIWHGTAEEWEALTPAERDYYDQAEVIDGAADLTLLGAVQAFLITPADPHWLLADGSTVSATLHPKLAAVMPVLPDLRECVLVGAGQNTENTIAAHDVYTVGQFKDDQFQGHEHNTRDLGGQFWPIGGPEYRKCVEEQSIETAVTVNVVTDGTHGTPRVGTTTHGKQTGVNWYIWAD